MVAESVAQPPGPAADAQGRTATDPSPNVLDLVRAHDRRQDDLRDMQERCSVELNRMRSDYEDKLREAEAKRIDAIRAVDVGAVNRAAEVSATQAQTLAAQVATSAETLRTQVAAAAAASTTALAAALDPIQKDIADLRKTQYEQAGQKTQVVESRSERGDSRSANGFVIAAIGLGITVLLALVTLIGVIASKP